MYGSEFMKTLLGKNDTMMPNLSALVLASITPGEFEFKYIDEEIEDIVYDKIDADIIAITCMTIQAKRAFEIAKEFKKRNFTVVMGGAHPTVLPHETLNHCDSVVVGEGEICWKHLLSDFKNNQLKPIYKSADYGEINNFPMPKYDVMDHSHYFHYPIQATRGCPYNCDFCAIKFTSGRKFRFKPVEQVIEEIKIAKSYDKGFYKKSFFFVDDNLYINREYSKKLFSEMSKLNITWVGQGSVNIAKDDEVLELMAQSGCRGFTIGFESISQSSLKEVNKASVNISEEYSNAIQKIQSYGIIVSGCFIFGFDHDGLDIFEKTVKFTNDTNIYTALLNILTPYPGTELRNRLEKEGRILNSDWSNYNCLNTVFSPKNMTPEDLKQGTLWAIKEVNRLKKFDKRLNNFWQSGTWKSNPPLNLLERAILLAISLGLWKDAEYRKFLFKAATTKNASDIYNIFRAIYMDCSLSRMIPDVKNPNDIIYKVDNDNPSKITG
jgi:radical SAM superfamily enzyme YgiQ (UPF0313 family)